MIALASATVLIENMPAARVGDMTAHTGCVAPILELPRTAQPLPQGVHPFGRGLSTAEGFAMSHSGSGYHLTPDQHRGHPGGEPLPWGLGSERRSRMGGHVADACGGHVLDEHGGEPSAIIAGAVGHAAGRVQGAVVSVKRAAGWPPIITVPAPLMMASGSAGCADGVGTGAGGWIGACSVARPGEPGPPDGPRAWTSVVPSAAEYSASPSAAKMFPGLAFASPDAA